MIIKALAYAAEKHSGQKRKSGEPYIEHPIRVCKILSDCSEKDETIYIAALLHDVVEDCGVEPDELRDKFGSKVVNIVCQLSTDKRHMSDFVRQRVEIYAIKSHYASMIRLADRIDNLRAPPPKWSRERLLEYVTISRKNYTGVNKCLDELFEKTAKEVLNV